MLNSTVQIARLSLLLVGAQLFTTGAMAGDTEHHKHARLDTNARALEQRISYPGRTLAQDVFVPCETAIGRHGRLINTHCYRNTKATIPFERRIIRRARGARGQAAEVNGERQEVWLQFGVLFRAADRSVHVYPHADSNRLFETKTYLSPQRYELEIPCPRAKLLTTVVKYRVDAGGGARLDQKTAQQLETGKRRRYKRCLASMRFIPATSDGEDIAAEIEEPFYRRDVIYR